MWCINIPFDVSLHEQSIEQTIEFPDVWIAMTIMWYLDVLLERYRLYTIKL